MSKERFRLGAHDNTSDCYVLLKRSYAGPSGCVGKNLPCPDCVIGAAYIQNPRLSAEELIKAHSKAMAPPESKLGGSSTGS